MLAYRRLERRPSKYAVRYTNLDVLAGVVGSTRSWRRHAGLALFLLALAALLVGVRSGITRPPGVRVELQIHAICVRGPS